MTALRSRIHRLEQANSPKAWGRFIFVRAGECTYEEAHEYLGRHGIAIGRRDLVFVDTHANPGSAGEIARDTPISHQIIECTRSIEDMLDELEPAPLVGRWAA